MQKPSPETREEEEERSGRKLRGGGFRVADPALLLEHRLTPMAAVKLLYGDAPEHFPETLISGLSQRIFDSESPKPSGTLRKMLARVVLRVLKRTTRRDTEAGPDGREVVVYRNSILERSRHPYAETLLRPHHGEFATIVEGGDPMLAPYLMLLPEIRRNACKWDKLFLDSVIGRDVQIRFVWETRMTYEIARSHLLKGEPVRLKAEAAGTGLSMTLVFDRLVRDGFDPGMIAATIADRADGNVAKANRLLEILPTTREHVAYRGVRGSGISAEVGDLLDATEGVAEPHRIVTLVGILEYFHGFTSAISEDKLGLPPEGLEADAAEMLRKVAARVDDSGTVIANSYRDVTAARILEVFGKRMRYRNRDNMRDLLESAGFKPTTNVRSGNVYDVQAFEKAPA